VGNSVIDVDVVTRRGSNPCHVMRFHSGHECEQGAPRAPDARFLQDFLKKRLWAEQGDDAGDSKGLYVPEDDEVEADVDDEDEEFLDVADDFERSYNFRFVVGHPASRNLHATPF
jgi:hypothetical protein